MANDTVQLKARIAHLEEELLYAHSVLSQTTETGCFHQSLNRYTSAEAILHDADKKVRLILPLIGTAFYLINEENADLELRFLQAPHHVTHALPQEWERLLEERLVAQALHTNQTIFRSTRDRDALWILHGIATQSRVRGLFLGLLGIPRENLRESALSLLQVALANLAHTLESFELYRILRSTNNELKTLVQELSLAHSRFQAIFEFLPMPAAIIDTTGEPRVTAINAQARGYSSCTQQDLPQPLAQIFPCIAGAVDLTRESDNPQSFGPLPCSCSGQQRWIAGQVLLVWPNQYLLLFEDRTHQRATELALEKTRRLARMLEDNARDLTVAVDLSGTVTYATPSAQTLLGYDPARLVGSPVSTILPPTALQAIQTSAQGHTLTLEVDILARTGETIPCEIVVTPLRDTQGHWDQVMMVVRDLRERRALEARIAHQSLYDGLTGLPQRSLFLSFIQRAIQAKRRTPHILPTVLLMEVSRFAQIGASLGPHVADDLLLQVAGRIQNTLRAQDALARLNTAEFGILVDNAPNGRTMLRLQHRLRHALEAPYTVDAHEIRLETSWGAAMILDPDSRPEDILHHASIALTQATATPHRRVQIFRPSLQRDLFHRTTLQQHLAQALDGGNEDAGTLDVYFQPIVNAATFQLWGFEALARWRHPQHGDIPPARFIPLAEESGLIHRLGKFVLEKACLYAGIWNAQQTVHVNVNLSPHQLTAPNLVEYVHEVLDAAQVAPQRMILEITESSLMTNPRLAVNTLRRLRQLGLGIAIDDFGTGYSSLAYLHQLPITALKIDRSFIASIHNPETQSLVQTILSLAFALGVSVTAEGVESPDQALLLTQLQAHTLQGFLFAHPLPADQASDLLRTGSVLRPTT